MQKRSFKKSGGDADAICYIQNCFAYRRGFCGALNNTDFGGRKCPFYKAKEQLEKEK